MINSINEIQVLEHNVKELQSQLHSAQVRIAALVEELDNHFDYKMQQKALTELNYDGNATRGRYGEDESV